MPTTVRSPGIVRPVVLLAIMLALVVTARTFTLGAGGEAQSGATLGAGLALVGGLFAGQIFAALRLPRITGYLCMGMAVGPNGFELINARMLGDLKLVNGVAIAFIALSAGLELNFRKLRPRLLTIGSMGLFSIGGVAAAITGLTWLLGPLLPHMDRGFTPAQRLAVAVLTGTIYATCSPAVAIAVRAETGSDGPVSETSMGLVVLGDIALVIGFTAVSAYVGGVFATVLGESSIRALLIELLGSLGVGAGLGFVLAIYVRRVAKKTALFAFGLCFIAAEAGGRLGLDPLLLCLAAGLTVENLTAVEGTRLAHDLEFAAMPTYAVFFCVAGAGIHLREFAKVAPWAVGFALLRAAIMLAGATVGGRLAGAPEAIRRWAPYGLLPQAGVAIGLATLVAKQFGGAPEAWGTKLAELLLGTIAVNELVGPAVLKWALGRAGEIGKREAAAGEH
jgi:Kef-type K+ transport system membrane component KefB